MPVLSRSAITAVAAKAVRFDIPEADVRAHGLASGSRLYVSMPLGQDTRVRIDTDGTVETLLTTPLLINGATEQDGVLTVSVFTTGVQTSPDEGLTWREVETPVPTGLTSHDGALYRGAEFGQELPLALHDTGEGLQEWLTIDAIGGLVVDGVGCVGHSGVHECAIPT